MANLRYVTLTGAGEKTSFARIQRISQAYPFVEWGVLYSPARAGLEARYPSLEWLEKFARKAGRRLNIALHLCGEAVKTVLKAAQDPSNMTDEAKRLFELASQFGRVQLNVRAKEKDEHRWRKLIQRLSRTENRTRVILQWNSHNEALCRRLWSENAFECLVDSSGGRGVSPEAWPSVHPQDVRRLGYAGGMGPDNLSAQLDDLLRVAGDRSFWVDMEAKLRDEQDRLDLDRCEAVLVQAQAFVERCWQTTGALHGTGRRKVASLSGYWLDWWVARALGYNVVMPPLGAVRAMLLYRPTGDYEAFQPGESGAIRLLGRERITLTPAEDETWTAQAPQGLSMPGKTPAEAGLRAFVALHYGASVPCNPARQD